MEDFIKCLEILNSIAKNLNIYDVENPDYCISGFEYNTGEDRVYVNFEEDKK